MKDKLFLLIGLVVILGSIYLFLQKPANKHYQPNSQALEEIPTPLLPKQGERILTINGETFIVEIARTDEERNLGLSGRETLPEGRGLFFIFNIPGKYGFWMKDMNFPIDIIWIDESWRVIGVERDINPETFPKIFYPVRAIKYVLELPAGTAKEKGIDDGSIVYLDS